MKTKYKTTDKEIKDLVSKIEEKIKKMEGYEVVYVDAEKNIELYAKKILKNSTAQYEIKATNLKSDYVKNYAAKIIDKDLLTIITGIKNNDPDFCDFSEAYKIDGITDAEVDCKIAILNNIQDIENINTEIEEEKEIKNNLEVFVDDLKTAEATIVNTIATYSKDKWGYVDIIYSTQRNEFAKIKYYTLDEIGSIRQLDCTAEDIKAQSYVEDTIATTSENIASALSYIKEQITNKEEKIQKQNDLIEGLQEQLIQSEKYLKEAKNELKSLLNK